MDDSNSDMVFRRSPEYVRQCALAMNCDLQFDGGLRTPDHLVVGVIIGVALGKTEREDAP
jgi:hypothetical protein